MSPSQTTPGHRALPRPAEAGPYVRQLEVDGFTIFPDMLSAKEVATLNDHFSRLPLTRPSAKAKVGVIRDVHRAATGLAIELIANPDLLAFLRHVLGDDLVCMSTSYARYEPGYAGMALHTDTQPYGSQVFGPLASVPVSLRVFYFLHDLTADRCPLRLVRSSHLCLHQGANPYQRYRSHPEEEIVTCSAGTAVIINPALFHAAGANRTSEIRAVYTLSYRPSWAGPVKRVPGRRPGELASLPPQVRALFKPPNIRRANSQLPICADPNTDPGSAPLGPRRWASRTS